METFYTYLRGPRTFWGGSNKTIINNNFIGGGCFPPPKPMCSPMMFPSMGGMFGFGSSCCGGGNNLQGWMNVFSFVNNMFGGNRTHQSIPQKQPASGGNNYAKLTAQVKKLEDMLAATQKQIDELTKENKASQTKTESTDNTKKSDKTSETGSTTGDNKANSTKQKSIDELLNGIKDFDKLTNEQKQYVKDRIMAAHAGVNGNYTYDIKATVHDGDTIEKIINRFYTEAERQDLDVAQKDFNAQKSGKLTKGVYSGATLEANGVSDFGIKALMQDAKANITQNSEVSKTDKRINQLKSDFKAGKQKISYEYARHNFGMNRAEYNKIIQSKYN